MCYERAIATAALWLNRNFEMMFLDMWDFSIHHNDKGTEGVGILINSGNWNLEEYIERYHGIRVTKKKIDDQYDFFNDMISEISSKRPVLFDDDWLVIGYDTKEKGVHVYIIHDSRLVYFPWEEFIPGKKEYVTFKLYGDEVREINPLYAKEHTKERILKTGNKKNLYEQIKEFAEIFYVAFDYALEIKDAVDIYEAPIVKNILDLSRGRKLFGLTLRYLNKLNNTVVYDRILDKLESAENKWLFIMSLFIKAYHSQSFGEDTRIKVYRNIKDVVDDEKSIYEYFCCLENL